MSAAFPSSDEAFPVLVGDIGGTNGRFGLVSKPGEPPDYLQHVKVSDFKNPETAIASILPHFPEKPVSAFFAIAGQVEGTHVLMTNADWTFDAAVIGHVCGFQKVSVINDFPPIAVALISLEEKKHLKRIGPVRSPSQGVRVVIGAGTGCGASALIPVGDQYLLQPTEIGLTHLGPEGHQELTLWPHLIADLNGPMFVEAVLSGSGIVCLHNAFLRQNRLEPSTLSPGTVLEAAGGGDQLAKETISVFLRILARVAGNLALIFQASGGVYIAGGIVPRLLSFLDEGQFRSEFENKPPLQDFLIQTSTFVIIEPLPALHGLATLAAAPQSFVAPVYHWHAESQQ